MQFRRFALVYHFRHNMGIVSSITHNHQIKESNNGVVLFRSNERHAIFLVHLETIYAWKV